MYLNMLSFSSYGTVERTDVEAQPKSEPCLKPRIWWMLGVDVPIFATLLILLGLFELGVIPSYKSGFYCNDPALAFPYGAETVTNPVLITGILPLPFFVIAITEYIYSETDRSRVRRSLAAAGWLYRCYLYGLVMNLTVVEVMKGVVGAPRPVFFELCEPDSGKTCNGSEYVSSFECTSTKYSWWRQMDSYRSFPSGHTSLSIYCGFFIAWYLQQRAFDWRNRSVLLVPFLQLAAVSFAVVSSLSRVTDHRHHWWDVLAGAGVGAVSLVYAVHFLCNYFTTSSLKDERSEDTTKSTGTLLYDDQMPT